MNKIILNSEESNFIGRNLRKLQSAHLHHNDLSKIRGIIRQINEMEPMSIISVDDWQLDFLLKLCLRSKDYLETYTLKAYEHRNDEKYIESTKEKIKLLEHLSTKFQRRKEKQNV